MSFRTITPKEVRAIMTDNAGEYALVDVREQGVHSEGHPFFAVPLPLSKLTALSVTSSPLSSVNTKLRFSTVLPAMQVIVSPVMSDPSLNICNIDKE